MKPLNRLHLGLAVAAVMTLILMENAFDARPARLEAKHGSASQLQCLWTCLFQPGSKSTVSPSRPMRPSVPSPPPTPLDPAARASGCTLGARAAAARATLFLRTGARKPSPVALGTVFRVAASALPSDATCKVVEETTLSAGTVPLRDIGPLDKVRTAIRTRFYYRDRRVTLAEFPDLLRASFEQRRAALQLDHHGYRDTLDAITRLVRHCAEVTEEQLDAAIEQQLRTGVKDRTYSDFKDCRVTARGSLVPGEGRSFFVKFALRGEQAGTPYRIRIEAAEIRASPAARPIEDDGLEQTLDLYDRNGVGSFVVSRPAAFRPRGLR